MINNNHQSIAQIHHILYCLSIWPCLPMSMIFFPLSVFATESTIHCTLTLYINKNLSLWMPLSEPMVNYCSFLSQSWVLWVPMMRECILVSNWAHVLKVYTNMKQLFLLYMFRNISKKLWINKFFKFLLFNSKGTLNRAKKLYSCSTEEKNKSNRLLIQRAYNDWKILIVRKNAKLTIKSLAWSITDLWQC